MITQPAIDSNKMAGNVTLQWYKLQIMMGMLIPVYAVLAKVVVFSHSTMRQGH